MREINRAILHAEGHPDHHALDFPGFVQGAIDRAKAYWAQSQDMTGTAAILAAGISLPQPFRDTNHRTAHTVVHRFLEQNGYPELAPEEDLELAEILAMDRDQGRGLAAQEEELTRLFRERSVRHESPHGAERWFTVREADSPATERLVLAPDIVVKQDPTHTAEEFARDLSRATRRVQRQTS